MKVKLDNGDIVDTAGKPYILLIHEGDVADIVINGTEYEAAQLIDAATRKLFTVPSTHCYHGFCNYGIGSGCMCGN